MRPPPVQAELQPCTLDVCTSCRPSGFPREPKENRPGFILFHELRDTIKRSPLRDRVLVRPAECLSVCPRPCGIALSSPESWTYIFGDQSPNQTASDIVDCLSIYLSSTDGFMPRKERPKGLRGSILGRVPPLKGSSQCT